VALGSLLYASDILMLYFTCVFLFSLYWFWFLPVEGKGLSCFDGRFCSHGFGVTSGIKLEAVPVPSQ
jgi:hypothetical protein